MTEEGDHDEVFTRPKSQRATVTHTLAVERLESNQSSGPQM